MNAKLLFHYVSYLQYPLLFLALFFAYRPYFIGMDLTTEKASIILQNLNNALIFMGLGISFSTLQDTTKVQNKLSKKIWEHPKGGKIAIIVIAVMAFAFIIYGLVGYLSVGNTKLKEVSIGIVVLGIGFIGLLKTSIEIFENHRKDKRIPINEVEAH
ncbi:MAG: hypothetical protein ACFB0B_08675 [Thermonemataceae bacterium]